MDDDRIDTVLEGNVGDLKPQGQNADVSSAGAPPAASAAPAKDDTTPSPAAPQSVTLSDDAISRLAASVGQAVKPPAAPAQPELSPEEVKKLLNYYEVGDKDLEELGLPPTAAAKLNMVLQAVVKQASTAAALHVEMIRRQLEDRLTPLQAMYQQQQIERLKGEFYEAHPDFKGKERLVEMVYGELERGGWQPKDKKEAFDHLATQVRQAIEQLLPGQGGGQNGNGQRPGAPAPGRRMPVLAGAGQAGGARGSKGGGSADDADRAETRWLLGM